MYEFNLKYSLVYLSLKEKVHSLKFCKDYNSARVVKVSKFVVNIYARKRIFNFLVYLVSNLYILSKLKSLLLGLLT